MKTLTSPLLFILILVSAYTNNVHEILSSYRDNREKTPISTLMKKEITDTQKNNNSFDKIEREIRNEQMENQCCLMKELRKAKEYLKCLLNERNVLIGDFYGVNITAYRYVNVFNRLGYIRYKIAIVEKEIEKTKLKISELKNKFDK